MKLDQSQTKFVSSDSRFVRLIAPAGAGKTHSLLQRCVRLSREHPNDRFLIFAFTKAARNELVARLQTDPSLRTASTAITVMTLNAWGNRLVKNRAPKARLIADNWDEKLVLDNSLQPVWINFPTISRALLDRKQIRAGRAILESMEALKSLGFRHDQTAPHQISAHVDWLIQLGLAPSLSGILDSLEEFGIADSTKEFAATLGEEFLPFWSEATETLHSQGFYTFEDQKYRPYLWLDSALKRGETWTGAARTAHIVVDEFQDINPLDLALIKNLQAINSSSLTLVGDDDQAIFEWRGSSPDFILEPEKYFAREFENHLLDTNYRSPANIVDLSQKLIRNNTRRVDKRIQAHSHAKAEVSLFEYQNVAECVSETTNFVRQLMADETIRTIALVSRKRSQILPYQITFASQDLPFYAAEDLNLGLSKAFEELQLLLGIRALSRQDAMPFGVSPAELVVRMADKVRVYSLSKSDRTSLVQYFKVARPVSIKEAVKALRSYTGPLKGTNSDAKNSIEFANAIQSLLDTETVSQALQAISGGFMGLQKDWGRSKDDIYYTDPPFFYLAAMAKPYGSDFEKFHADVKAALDKLAKVPEDDGLDESYDENQLQSKLHLMTALRAKGREFDVVIVLDSNDEIWPIRLAKTAEQMEQERRLFYVAMTRAKTKLRFVYSRYLIEGIGEASIEEAFGEIQVDHFSPVGPRKPTSDIESLSPSRYLGEIGLLRAK